MRWTFYTTHQHGDMVFANRTLILAFILKPLHYLDRACSIISRSLIGLILAFVSSHYWFPFGSSEISVH